MKKITKLTAAVLLAITPIASGIISNTTHAATIQTNKISKGTMTIVREDPIITKNGAAIKKSWAQPDTDAWQIKAGVAQTIPNKSITFTGEEIIFQQRQYLGVGNGGYVNAYNISKINGQNTFMLNHNAYVYNKYGQRIKNFRGQSKFLKNRIAIRTVSDKNGKGKFYYTINGSNYTVSAKTIKGKSYFNIGNGGYIKAINFNRVNASQISTTGPVTVKVMVEDQIVRLNGKKYTDTKTKLKANQKLVVDKLVHIKSLDTEDPALFYHIKGTKNDWVMAEGVSTVDFQMPVSEER